MYFSIRKDILMNEDNSKKTPKSARIVALLGIVFLVALYVVTFFAAIFDNSATGNLFRVCLFATIAIPLLLWIYLWLFQKVKERKDEREE